jgi:putative transposase
MSIVKSNHCAYDTHYHIVFPVKYRKALLSKEIELTIVNTAKEISERYEIIFEQIGCDADHIHLLCSFHPKISITTVVTTFKSITAKQLFKTHPYIKKELWGGEFWSDGYFVSTVGSGGNLQQIYKYVQNQGKTLKQPQLSLWLQ